MTKPIKFGKIELPAGPNTSPLVPKNASKFIDHGEILKTLAIAIRDNVSALMIGESGTGKTSAIRYLAGLTGNGLSRVNLNGGTTSDELIGRLLINENGTYWTDGILTEAMRNGDWIVLDEINAALPEVLFVLQSLLDDDGYIVLNEKDDKEIVRKHPNFRFFATCNPPEYAGTKEMNKALLSRFGICINAEFPSTKTELEIIASHLGENMAQTELAVKLVGMAQETREAKAAGNSDYAINTRDILHTLKLSEYYEPTEALCIAFANKLDDTDRKALKSLAKLHLPSKKTAMATRKKITTPEDLKIGSTYTISADANSAYFGLTDNEKTAKDLAKKHLGEIIESCGRDNAFKDEEFVIEAIYYEESEEGSESKEKDGLGAKAASLIKFTTGANKNQKAVLVHHKDLDNTIRIIDNLYEIS